MLKFYTSILVLTITLCSISPSSAQSNEESQEPKQETIVGLNIYPNPSASGKLYISSKSNFSKTIEIFDVLGKKVLSASMYGKELDISKLTPGVYVIKVEENEITATRKLVVR